MGRSFIRFGILIVALGLALVAREYMANRHSKELGRLNDQGEAAFKQGDYEKAISLFQQVDQKVNEESSREPQFFRSQLNLVKTYSKLEDYPKALASYQKLLKWYEKDVDGFESKLPKGTPLLGRHYEEVAKIQSHLKDYAGAESSIGKAIDYYNARLDNEMEYMSYLFMDVGTMQTKQKKYSEAEKSFRKSIEISKKHSSGTVLKSLFSIAKNHNTQGKYDAALQVFEEVLPVLETKVESGSKGEKLVLEEYAKTLEALGRAGEAQEVRQRI